MASGFVAAFGRHSRSAGGREPAPQPLLPDARPVEYALLVDVFNAVLNAAGRALPLLEAGFPGGLPAPRLAALAQQAIESFVLDRAWQHDVCQRLADHSLREQRGLGWLMRGEEERQRRAFEEAEGRVRQLREAVVAPANVEWALREALTDGLLAMRNDADTPYLAPATAPLGRRGAFHGGAIRDAVLAHLDEVRAWRLPASDPEQYVAHAREHSQVLSGSSVQQNSMLRSAVRQAVEQALVRLCEPVDSRADRYLELVLLDAGVQRAVHGSLDVWHAAERVFAAVAAPHNVERALHSLADDGLLRRQALPDGSLCFLDPDLERDAQADPARHAALQRLFQPAPPPPIAVVAPVGPAAIRDRLRILQDLFAEELITQAELDQRRAEILREV